MVMGLVLSALPSTSPLGMAVPGLGPCSGFKQPLLTITTLSLARSTYCPGKVCALAADIKGHGAASGKKGAVFTAEVAARNWASLYATLWPTV